MTRPVRFDTTQYQFSHGRKPRGTGAWAFATSSDPEIEDVVFSPGGMPLTVAKRWAVAKLAPRNPYTIYVLP